MKDRSFSQMHRIWWGPLSSCRKVLKISSKGSLLSMTSDSSRNMTRNLLGGRTSPRHKKETTSRTEAPFSVDQEFMSEGSSPLMSPLQKIQLVILVSFNLLAMSSTDSVILYCAGEWTFVFRSSKNFFKPFSEDSGSKSKTAVRFMSKRKLKESSWTGCDLLVTSMYLSKWDVSKECDPPVIISHNLEP